MHWYEEQHPFDQSKLSDPSGKWAVVIFDHFPQFEKHAQIYRANDEPRFDLVIDSPSKHKDRNLVLWYDYHSDSPSLSFGNWHTHGILDVEVNPKKTGMGEDSFMWDDGLKMIDIVEAILRDRVVLIEDVGTSPGDDEILDLNDKEDLAIELSSPFASGRFRIKSWTGNGDKELNR